MKIGVFGGTFDPVHIGHLIIAQEALVRQKLDEVLFVPSKDPWLKTAHSITPADDRVAMVKLAIAGHGQFKLSMVDLEREGPSYTVDTLSDLQRQTKGADLFFILGMDSLLDLPRWRDPQRILGLARLIAFSRPGYNHDGVAKVEQVLPGLGKRLILMEEPLIGISSTEVRDRAVRALPIKHWVPEVVEAYVENKRLYGKVKG